MKFYLYLPKFIPNHGGFNLYVIIYDLRDCLAPGYYSGVIIDAPSIITSTYWSCKKDELIEITDQELIDKYNKLVVFK